MHSLSIRWVAHGLARGLRACLKNQIGPISFFRQALSLGLALPAFAVDPSEPVDLRFRPPQWQTSICLPDDPSKTLVDRSGELLYGYGQGHREFATRIRVEVVPEPTWRNQELLSPRVPIVRTTYAAPSLEILEEAFAVTNLRQPEPAQPLLERIDGGGISRDWAKPGENVDPSLRHIAVHMGGSIQYRLSVPTGGSRRIALALCEGWWKEPAKRIQVLRVEGAPAQTVDTIADLGPHRAGAFWLDGRDTDRNGSIEITIQAAADAADKNTILNGLWVFPPNFTSDSAALLAGRLNSAALARMDLNRRGGPARNDLVLVRVTNTGSTPQTLHPRLIVDTTLPFRFQPESQRALVDEHAIVTASLPMRAVNEEMAPRHEITLAELVVPAGKSATFFALHSGGGTPVVNPRTLKQALACRERAVAYWTKAPLPYGRVQVPDAGIQALIDSSIRNIWQAREIKQGLPAFQVGPTCYRGLWIVDGAFLLEAATLLGAGAEARAGVAYELTYQQPDGRIEVMANFPKENGIVLWTCVRHAQLTQDKAWLESVWPKLERIATHIQILRRRTLENDTPLDDGLIPPGFPDGGLGGVHAEYTNPYWNLVGLKAFIAGAQWLGRPDAAARWQAEYDAFVQAYQKAAQRDLARDPHGHAYVPTLMGEAGRKELPQRGQWAFCHAVYPGQVFPQNDPLVLSTLAMLQATEREGMVYGTGWDATGLWNYFASFYGHAWLWQGNGHKAADTLYAFANHASPTLVWREEQSLQGEPFKKVGDMPHNWASAEFIRLAIHLLALDRGDELHLLEGFPAAWARPGQITRLNGVATPFGPLHLTVQANRSGKNVTLRVRPLASSCARIVVHHPNGTQSTLNPQRGGTLSLRMPH